MAIILFDNPLRKHLQPLVFTRAVADLRFGIWRIRERWEQLSGEPVYVHTETYLRSLYPAAPEGEHLWIDASMMLDTDLVDGILSLGSGHCLADEQGLLGGRMHIPFNSFDPANTLQFFQSIRDHSAVRRLEYPWQLMQWNDEMIRFDFSRLMRQRSSQPLPATINVVGPENIFIEEGAKLSYCTINAATGPVYIGRDAEIMEGTAIRGPFVLGHNSVLKMNSRVYGATTLGPYCMGGGEIKNTVMMGYSNKAHDGYLGDSVVGEWCNFGAGSTNSNIKNTAGDIKLWAMGAGLHINVGSKCGMVMGDYSRAAINSSINTGTVVGIACNVFGQGLLPTYIKNFSWGVEGAVYSFPKALQDIANWKKMKGMELTAEETSVLQTIFEQL